MATIQKCEQLLKTQNDGTRSSSPKKSSKSLSKINKRLVKKLELKYQNPEYVKMEDLLRFKRKQLRGEFVVTKKEKKMTNKISRSLNRITRKSIEEDEGILQAYHNSKEQYSNL